MSRSNHYRTTRWEPEAKPFRKIVGRRNWERKPRWPKYALGSAMNPPPRWWWRAEHSKARATYRQMMLRSDDPALPTEKELIDLWGWY